MLVVVRIPVARAHREPAAQPRLKLRQNGGLITGLNIERIGALRLRAPAPGLHRNPAERIEDAGVRGERVNAVRAPRLNVNVLGILRLHGGRAIVGLQDVAEVVIIDGEEARVGRVIAVAPFLRERRIREADAIPSPAIRLKHTARGSRARRT